MVYYAGINYPESARNDSNWYPVLSLTEINYRKSMLTDVQLH